MSFAKLLEGYKESVTYVADGRLPQGVAFEIVRGEMYTDRNQVSHPTVLVCHTEKIRFRLYLQSKYSKWGVNELKVMNKDIKKGEKFYMVSAVEAGDEAAVVDFYTADQISGMGVDIYDPTNDLHKLKTSSPEKQPFKRQRSD